MAADPLRIQEPVDLNGGRMILAFTGWMDGGDVSTGTVRWLADTLEADAVAEIDPDDFYIYNFPGSMEISALFRPFIHIEDGQVQSFEPPSNIFYCHKPGNLMLFSGKEPNLNWPLFAECVFRMAERSGISMLYFIGSFGGLVPHTRAPRLIATVSDDELKADAVRFGLGLADYEGPASFASYLMSEAPKHNVRMMSLVAEIPPYIESTNPKSIEAVIRKLVAILDVQVEMDALRTTTDSWERRINKVLKRKPELIEHIHKLEEDYDNEVFDTQMGDLKEWLERQGIRVD
jgi:proteasome assembly chaperone (PAC2) family protein